MKIAEMIHKICHETHLPMVQAAFGKPGVDAAFRIMGVAQSLYRHVEPERISGRIVIFQIVESLGEPSAPAGPAADFASLANLTVTEIVIELASDGQPYLRPGFDVSLEELAKKAVVYHWQANRDEFLAGDERKFVLRLDPSARSQFAVPTFSNLRDALQNYATENVRESTCYLFQKVWSGDNRLFLRAGPEEIMRNSLTQFLKNRLAGDHDVWPEQNVDESHPVDIQVKPRFSNNRLMLIEIKWLGWSVAEDGHVTARHKNPRAQAGADQLAQYLEDKRKFAPSSVIQGYYVIIDCRRENLHESMTTITHADGMFYECKDLLFDPAYDKTRNDFDPPYRMFARPICVD
jgi:hypothetical protein